MTMMSSDRSKKTSQVARSITSVADNLISPVDVFSSPAVPSPRARLANFMCSLASVVVYASLKRTSSGSS